MEFDALGSTFYIKFERKKMTKFLQEILEQPKAIHETGRYYATPDGCEALAAFVEAARSARRVIATGMGSSYFLSGALQAFLSLHGIAVTVINAGELLHYQLNAVTDDTLLVAVSQSGESYETVNVVRQLAERGIKPRLAVITNQPKSTLGQRADILLPTVAGVEEKTSTKTFITGFQILYMIDCALGGNEADANMWERLAADIEDTLNQRHNTLPGMLRALGSASYIQLIARGTAMASASQSALMAMEASHTPSQALAGGEFRHGPLEMVGDGFMAIVLASAGSPTIEQTRRVVGDILRFGGGVLLITDNADAMPANDSLTVVTVKSPCEALFPIAAIIPVQLAIEAWAREVKGITPGEFTHGLKVTDIE